MNRTKTLIIIYLLIAIIVISAITYMDYQQINNFINETKQDEKIVRGQVISEVRVSRTLDVDKTELFEMMTDIQQYPKVLPDYIESIKIINQSQNAVYTEEEWKFPQNNVKVKLPIKHTMVPGEIHSILITSGDAKDSIISTYFEEINNSTRITVYVKSKLGGSFSSFNSDMKNHGTEIINEIIDVFENRAIGIFSESEIRVNELYKELLNRTADTDGLKYYSSLLDSEKMTLDEIRKTIMESPEYKSIKQN